MYNTKIARPTFINWLDLWRDKDVIKVVTGVRRCGKTTLLELFGEKEIGGPIERRKTSALVKIITGIRQ